MVNHINAFKAILFDLQKYRLIYTDLPGKKNRGKAVFNMDRLQVIRTLAIGLWLLVPVPQILNIQKE